MRLHKTARFLSACLLGLAVQAQAVTAWDESTSGDLSSSGLSPTLLSFASGANTVAGTIGSADSDYFSFVVPAGMVLSAVNMNPGTSVSGAASFIAIQAGSQVTYPAGGTAALLAFNHYDAGLIGTNILVGYLLPSTSPGLMAGTYSIWLNETGGQAPYSFDFVLTAAVPEPTQGLLLAAGLLGLMLAHRRSSGPARETAPPAQLS